MVAKQKLIKAKGSLPSWFSLANYNIHLSKEQWLDALVWRATAQSILDEPHSAVRAMDIFRSFVLEPNPKTSKTKSLLSSDEHISDIWGVRELPAFDAAYLAAMIATTKKGGQLALALKNIRKKKDAEALWSSPSLLIEQSRREVYGALVDWDAEPYKLYDVLSGFPVIVDLDQDDETLLMAFKVWLAGIRSEIGPAPKPVDEKVFQAWNKYGLLPAFDLYFWARLNNIRFSDSLVANAIWPDAEFDNAERLRKVTRPKLDEVFQWGFVTRFWRQLELEKALNKFVEGGKER